MLDTRHWPEWHPQTRLALVKSKRRYNFSLANPAGAVYISYQRASEDIEDLWFRIRASVLQRRSYLE